MTGLFDSGIRWALYADLMLLFGLPLFGLYGAPARRASAAPSARVWLGYAALAVFGLGASLAGLVVTAATMAGIEPTAIDRATLAMVATQTALGTSVIVRCAGLVASIMAAWWLGRGGSSPARAAIALGGAVALGSLAWGGHAAGGEGWTGMIHLGADIVHLGAAGAWLGALGALLAMVLRSRGEPPAHPVGETHAALRRFAHTGSILVALVVASGALNTAMLVGFANIASLPATPYGQLLIAKLALFCAMLALAAANRFRLTPALAQAATDADRAAALAALRRSITLETGSAVLILALVAWLGTLEPPLAAAA